MMHSESRDLQFCSDEELGYLRSRTGFEAGRPLQLDASYRLAHLPLVAPDHPDSIAAREGMHYRNGHHPESFSLVMPLDGATLQRSEPFMALQHDVRTSPFARKIAWPVVERRWGKLHATISGALDEAATGFDVDQLRALESIGPMQVEVRGVFSGNVNIGRLYLRVYPERRGGDNAFHRIQRALGRRQTDLFLIGLYNLTDHLDAGETQALAALIERWWPRLVLRLEITELWLLAVTDDLALESRIAQLVPLSPDAGS